MPEPLSVIVPAYNEQENIEKALTSILACADSWNREWELIAVDDGSADATAEIAEKTLAGRENCVVQRSPQNRGFCEAVKTGIGLARHPLVVYVPSDNQFDMADIVYFLQKADEGADAVVGYRPGRPGYSLVRKIQSRVFMAMFHLMYGLRVRDVNWVHLYRREVVAALPLKSTSIFMMAEILIRCRHEGRKIVEIPTRYLPRTAGMATGGKPAVIFKTISEMFALYVELKRSRPAS